MQPEIHLGSITLQTFGIMFALAFIAAGAVVGRRLREWGKPPDWAYELILCALAGGIIGARLDFIAENYDSVKHDLLGNLFSGSGLVWYGGAIGGAIGVGLWAWRRGMLNAALLDLCAAPLALGYAIGRIGCQVSGDGDYGKAWSGPWAMAYPHGTKPIDETVHPTPIYETLAMGLVAWFLVEFIRRNDHVFLGLTQAQLISLAMIAGGAGWLAAKRRRGPLTKPVADEPRTAAIRATT
ncbi:MAG: hypothetical protein AUG48_07865 [Actinobacteria bacterium 13_1_20CM_3_68_9]|nr:MAG: hypothetical protein AUG48_07865 [Actinobacteria bacterium 13_1_20CM_3_68_9]